MALLLVVRKAAQAHKLVITAGLDFVEWSSEFLSAKKINAPPDWLMPKATSRRSATRATTALAAQLIGLSLMQVFPHQPPIRKPQIPNPVGNAPGSDASTLLEGRHMDTAYSLLDRKACGALQFSELQSGDRETLRHRLSCTECAAPAFFRGGSQSAGRQPCFGARPHRPGCSLATMDLAARRFDAQGLGGRIDDPYEAVILNMAPRPVSASWVGEIDGDIDAPNEVEGGIPVPAGASRTTRRRPSTILRALQSTESFQWSTQLIAIPGGSFVPMREFLVPFDRVHPMLERVTRGWWGTVSSVGVDPYAQVWLNSGAKGCLTCPMGPEIANEVLRRARVQWDDVEALVGASVLVIGEMRMSPSGIPVCGVKSAEHIALILA